MRTLPAAAITAGDVVVVTSSPADGAFTDREARLEVTVRRVRNADPVAGRIVWETDEGEVAVGAADLVEVVSL